MRENLVFYGISESNAYEDSELLVRRFIQQQMNINTDNIEIERAHRMGQKRNGQVRPIVVKFLRYKDKENVRKAAPKTLNVLSSFPTY